MFKASGQRGKFLNLTGLDPSPALYRLLQLHDVAQRRVGAFEEAPDAPRRLADALLVLDERKADVTVARGQRAYVVIECRDPKSKG